MIAAARHLIYTVMLLTGPSLIQGDDSYMSSEGSEDVDEELAGKLAMAQKESDINIDDDGIADTVELMSIDSERRVPGQTLFPKARVTRIIKADKVCMCVFLAATF